MKTIAAKIGAYIIVSTIAFALCHLLFVEQPTIARNDVKPYQEPTVVSREVKQYQIAPPASEAASEVEVASISSPIIEMIEKTKEGVASQASRVAKRSGECGEKARNGEIDSSPKGQWACLLMNGGEGGLK